jgi:UDP-GlcNAc3NAcA epimerase
MLNLMTIIGARPQFVKAAMISRALMTVGNINEDIIHTGQHYDSTLSKIFFTQLGIPEPKVRLELGGGSHGKMTARMIEALEVEMVRRKPDKILIYGDTNSTLAGALAAAKLHLPVAHIEAGLRSFNRRMPEEINRVLSDHISTWLFCPTSTAVNNLKAEGITQGVHHVGDVMLDAVLSFAELARKESKILDKLGLKPNQFLLATVHRQENTEDPSRMEGIIAGFRRLAAKQPLVWPVHPRLNHSLALLAGVKGLYLTEPLSFIDMMQLEMNAKLILTDSGGVQKEAYFHKTPCLTLRDETEWVETVTSGWNQLAGTNPDNIVAMAEKAGPGKTIDEYGDGRNSFKIVRLLATD